MSHQSRFSTNGKGDNEIIPMKAVRQGMASNGVPYLQMRSGRVKEGDYERRKGLVSWDSEDEINATY